MMLSKFLLLMLYLQADSDGDGYLSCIQVLEALKEIIPPELLTEEEEIYVYRVNLIYRNRIMRLGLLVHFFL